MSEVLFHKLLIANRGEIACRIMQTAHQLGIQTVAIYAPNDHQARHVQLASEAWQLKSDDLSESYLDAAQIIHIAQQTGATAIHPGYGFLSENADFAQACEDAGIIFVGPLASTIRSMAQKDAAKQLMQAHGVPVMPGFIVDDEVDRQHAARQVGFPLLIKAVGGGGGKGMRLIHHIDELATQIAQAEQEAQQSFGDGRVICERYLSKARHIEVQIFFDQHGQGISMFERDCSLQRRYQKVIEFAPSHISDQLRQRMGEVAVAAGKAVSYRGAGTVEFLLSDDGSDEFFFLEMNTRLQVEHPVTEILINEDLVAWQLQVAAGLPLPKQTVQIHQHAMELRIYAENPANEFAPSSGVINHINFPSQQRVDHGIVLGQAIGNRYDPMLAKLIVAASSYAECRQQARQALQQCYLGGVHTNIAFLMALLDSEPVRTNQITVKTLEQLALLPVDHHAAAMIACWWQQLMQQNQHHYWRQWSQAHSAAAVSEVFFDQHSKSLQRMLVKPLNIDHQTDAESAAIDYAQSYDIQVSDVPDDKADDQGDC